MAKCKECGESFGFLELSSGVCKSCINNKKPPCLGCGKNFDVSELQEGRCAPCFKSYQNKRFYEAEERKRFQKSQQLESLTAEQFGDIMLTTEMAPNIEIEKRIEIITAECAFGMNIFKDMFTNVRDVVGGRSGATQNLLKDARVTVLNELRKEAYLLGANAVVAVDLDGFV